MLHATSKFNTLSWSFNNLPATPNTTPGALISTTAGSANTKGAWTRVASSTDLVYDVDGIYFSTNGAAASGNTRPHLIDIGVDPAGGTSYTPLINNIIAGQSSTQSFPGLREHYFPIRIRKGSSVACRTQSVWGSALTTRVVVEFYGAGSSNFPIGTYSDTYGAVTTTSRGTDFTPGSTNADGSWVQMGSNTTRPYWWFQLGVQVTNNTLFTTSEGYNYIELGIGDGTNKKVIYRTQLQVTPSETCLFWAQASMLWHACYCPIPAGVGLYVRGRNSGTPNAGYNAAVVCIGGNA